MESKITEITYDVHLLPGEELSLPEEATEILGPGHWTVSIRPADDETLRDHASFSNSYAPEDEGLYDENSAG